MKKIYIVLIGISVGVAGYYFWFRASPIQESIDLMPTQKEEFLSTVLEPDASDLHQNEDLRESGNHFETPGKGESDRQDNGTVVRKKERYYVEVKPVPQEQLDKAAREFEVFLKEREAGYPTIVPEPGMISVSNALDIATAYANNRYDKSQKPKIELDKGVYRVTFWGLRRPILSATGFSAIVDVDAWSGEVVYFLISAD